MKYQVKFEASFEGTEDGYDNPTALINIIEGIKLKFSGRFSSNF